MNITINISNEITALWLSELFKIEIEGARGASSNEQQNREYSELLQKAYNDIQKYWSK